MSANGYRRRNRAPKPLRVPLLAVLFGAVVFFLGMALASAAMAGLGLLVGIWGLISFSFLVISRRIKAARAASKASSGA